MVIFYNNVLLPKHQIVPQSYSNSKYCHADPSMAIMSISLLSLWRSHQISSTLCSTLTTDSLFVFSLLAFSTSSFTMPYCSLVKKSRRSQLLLINFFFSLVNYLISSTENIVVVSLAAATGNTPVFWWEKRNIPCFMRSLHHEWHVMMVGITGVTYSWLKQKWVEGTRKMCEREVEDFFRFVLPTVQ